MKQSCTVTNKSAGTVIYNTRTNGRSVYAPRESRKNVSVTELEQLVQQPGGKDLFYNYLMIDDNEILEYLINGKVEPEYWIKEEDLPTWMTACTLDEFRDALDFAPDGTKDLIKNLAVSMPLNDFDKREAIKRQLNFDVTRVLENLKNDNEEDKQEEKPTSRRAAASDGTPKRRAVPTSIKKPQE